MTGDTDPKTNFALVIVQTELERYKYLVRSLLRARIAKVRVVCLVPKLAGSLLTVPLPPSR